MLVVVVSTVALFAAALTFVSGFGLGTLLLPAFAIFVPIEVAVAATACVHLANNIFKLILTAKNADRSVLIRFGLIAVIASIVGALLQRQLGEMPSIHTYVLAGVERSVTPIRLAIGAVITCFALLELSPRFDRLEFDRSKLPLGGFISGFFGGLSGHQGALRSAFLVRCGLSKESLIATGVVCSVLVDVPRLGVYATRFNDLSGELGKLTMPLLFGCVAAFLGTLIGARVVKKITLSTVRMIVGVTLLFFGPAMMAGLVL